MSYSLECVIMKWVNQLLPLNMEFLIKLTHTYNHTHYLSHGYNDSHLTQLSLNCCVNECTVRNSIWLTSLITLITLRFVGHVGWFPVHVSEWVSGLRFQGSQTTTPGRMSSWVQSYQPYPLLSHLPQLNSGMCLDNESPHWFASHWGSVCACSAHTHTTIAFTLKWTDV